MIDPVSSNAPSQSPINWEQSLATFNYAEAAEKFEELMSTGIETSQFTPEDQGHLVYFGMIREVLMDGFRRSQRFADHLSEIYNEMKDR